MGTWHGRLKVHQLAIELLEDVAKTAEGFGGTQEPLVTQLKRVAGSVPLNISEGSERYTPEEKRGFYEAARQSCYECATVVDRCFSAGVVRVESRGKLRERLETITKMLTRLIQSVEDRRKRGEGTRSAT